MSDSLTTTNTTDSDLEALNQLAARLTSDAFVNTDAASTDTTDPVLFVTTDHPDYASGSTATFTSATPSSTSCSCSEPHVVEQSRTDGNRGVLERSR